MPIDIEAWDPWSPAQLSARLEGIGERWAVAGGWALELFAGTARRSHDDLEIVIGRDGFAGVQHALPELEWFAAADGTVRPLVEPDAQLAETWQTWGWESLAQCWRVDVMREPWTEREWVYRRRPTLRVALDQAIAVSDQGVPYLAPELVLLFKAKHQRDKDNHDLAATLPLLQSAQRRWLASALRSEQPTHPWLSTLS